MIEYSKGNVHSNTSNYYFNECTERKDFAMSFVEEFSFKSNLESEISK